MPRPRKEPEAKPSDDVGWNFGTPTGNRGELLCNFCGKKITSGITRLKQHLAHLSGQVSSCPKVSENVRKDMQKLLLDFDLAKKDKARKAKELEKVLV